MNETIHSKIPSSDCKPNHRECTPGDLRLRQSQGDRRTWNEPAGDAANLLGLDPVVPPLRQSTINSYWSCPRFFLFAHRFGLHKKAERPSSALTVGRFVHMLLADHYTGIPYEQSVKRCGASLEEDVNRLSSIEHPLLDVPAIAATMETDLALARTLFEVYRECYPPNPRYRTLGVEETIRYKQPGIPVPIEGTLDLLIEDTETNELWIPDFKTTSDPPLIRAATCSFEVQPRLYRLLASAKYKGKRVAGCTHTIIQKPTIKFCKEDRPFEWYDHVLKSGPCKGQVERRKKYLNEEPSYSCYLDRVKRWFTGTGEFEDLTAQRAAGLGPPILESWVRYSYGPTLDNELFATLFEVGKACRVSPHLHKFPRRASSCYHYNRPCPFLPFCQSNPKMWKSVRAEQFEVKEKS